ncbi:membrane protein [Aliidongia dinghuensis]|uniref:Membrane protein n=1 Tax=Aliidongia dinghuensis TaxID=1867774 RepID=A0A8J3E384_9PROT|nr:EamA family transporter [Aliidongia dinghuensis]GGF28205.1 membrane protein [Aliidongia dinghuensis]
MRSRLDPLTLLAILATLLVWSSSFACISYGLRSFSPGELALLRFLVASLCFLPAIVTGRIPVPERRDWPMIALLGLMGITLYQVCLGTAQTRISAGAAAVVIALVPGVTAALAALRLGERLSARAWGGLGVAFLGAILITVGAGKEIRFEPLALLALVSVFATSGYFVLQRPLMQRMTPIGFTAWSLIAGAVGLLPFGFHLPAAVSAAPAGQILSVVYLGVAPSALGYILWNFALSRAPVSRVASFIYLQPLIATLIAWAWLGQVPTLIMVLGGSAAVGGVILANTAGATAKRPARAACEETV